MTDPAESSPAAAAAATGRYKGVRKRKWGKWVSEVRLPNSRKRIWLGSYDSPEKAARAFDAGSFLLRGHRASLNFPDRIQEIAICCSRLNPTPQQIQTAAARYALEDLPALSRPLPPLQQPVLAAAEGSPPSPAMNQWGSMDQLISPTPLGIHEFYYDMVPQKEQLEQTDLDVENSCDYTQYPCLWNF